MGRGEVGVGVGRVGRCLPGLCARSGLGEQAERMTRRRGGGLGLGPGSAVGRRGAVACLPLGAVPRRRVLWLWGASLVYRRRQGRRRRLGRRLLLRLVLRRLGRPGWQEVEPVAGSALAVALALDALERRRVRAAVRGTPEARRQPVGEAVPVGSHLLNEVGVPCGQIRGRRVVGQRLDRPAEVPGGAVGLVAPALGVVAPHAWLVDSAGRLAVEVGELLRIDREAIAILPEAIVGQVLVARVVAV